MALVQVDGIVVREVKVGEQDKILTVFTEQLGKITVGANGIRSAKSKFSAARLLCYSHYTLYEGKGNMYRISECNVLHNFSDLAEQIDRFSCAMYFGEIISYGEAERNPNPALLRLYLNALHLLTHSDKPLSLIKAVFELRAACSMGVAPQLEACVQCGRELLEEPVFSHAADGLVCRKCCSYSLPVPAPVVQMLHYICKAEARCCFSFQATERSLRILSRITEEYLLHHLERTPKTLEYLKNMTEE